MLAHSKASLNLWVLQQEQQVPANPQPCPFPVSPAPTSPVVGSGSHQRVRHSLPAAAAVSKSGSSSAPGPGQPPAPQQSPAATWPGPAGTKGLSKDPAPHPAPDERTFFLPFWHSLTLPQAAFLRSDLHYFIDLRSIKDCTLSSISTSQSITHLTWPSPIGRSFYQAVQRH